MLRRKKDNIGDLQLEPKDKKRKKKKIVIIACIILFLILMGIVAYFCIFNKKEEKKIIKKKKTKVVEKKKLNIVDEDSNKRPIAIMIDNNVGNNNHCGLQDAYITYEIIVEGGLTRIMAVFKDRNTELIGPIRSSRHYFLDYASESDAIYTHFGWSTFAEKDIRSLGINNINGLYDNAFWRDNKIAAPHNVFTSLEKLYSYADGKGYKTETDNWNLLNYSTDKINLDTTITKTVTNEETGKKEKQEVQKEGVLTANSISMSYSRSQSRSYSYNSETGEYLRNMNNTPHIDKTTGRQLSYKNLIIAKVSNSRLDDYGRQDLKTVGSGEGYYITNGYALPITWEKGTRTGKTEYKYIDGEKLKVNDGTTFIQIVPTDSNITIE